MSDKLTSEQIERIRINLANYDDVATTEAYRLLRHIAALEAENARRDQALIEYMGGDGHWQMLNGDSAESILAGFNAAHPTSQTVKDPSHD